MSLEDKEFENHCFRGFAINLSSTRVCSLSPSSTSLDKQPGAKGQKKGKKHEDIQMGITVMTFPIAYVGR